MKKIAFVLNSFNIGGIPKVAIPFLEQLKDYYEVTLFLSSGGGDLYSQIPNGIKKVFVKDQKVKELFVNRLKSGKIFSTLFLFLKWLFLGKRIVKKAELLAPLKGLVVDTEFDAVFCYHGMNLWNLMTGLYRIKAKKKIAWIHGEHPYTGKDKKDIEKVYNKFDRIYCVSKKTKEDYAKYFPTIIEKLDVYYNYLDISKVYQLSKESINDVLDSNFINILTVGRISPEKGQDLIPTTVKKLIDDGYKIKWYIVGDGNDRERIENIVKGLKVQDSIIFVGNKKNPYPYMKNCDIYVQPSYSEGYSTTICEAGVFGKSIVATNTSGGIKEQIDDGINGFLCDPKSEDICNKIKYLIDNPDIRKKIGEEIKKVDFSHKDEIKKLLEYI